MSDKDESMPKYQVRGFDHETGRKVTVDMGWSRDVQFFFAIYPEDSDREMAGDAHMADWTEIVDRTRTYITWNRQLRQAMRDAIESERFKTDPHSPTTKLLTALR